MGGATSTTVPTCDGPCSGHGAVNPKAADMGDAAAAGLEAHAAACGSGDADGAAAVSTCGAAAAGPQYTISPYSRWWLRSSMR